MQPPPPLLVAPILLFIFCFVFLGKGKKLKTAKSAYTISGQNLELQDMIKISGQMIFFRNFRTSGTPEYIG